MENTQNVFLKGMKEIYDCACNEWKKTITEWTNPFGDTELTESQIKSMFSAANNDQKKVLNKYLEQVDSNLSSRAKKELSKLVLPYSNPSNKEEKCLNATLQLLTLTKTYNNGVELDWNNTNQYKYFIYKYLSDGGWVVASFGHGPCRDADASVGLYFVERSYVEDVIKNFPEIINDYFMI